MGGVGNLPAEIAGLMQAIQELTATLGPFLHPEQVVGQMLKDSVGMLLSVWYDLVLRTTDLGNNGGDFTKNKTIGEIEPAMQAVADSALVLAAIWASYRIMWGHGIRTQFSARVLLPRLLMGVVLVNFAMPLFQAAVDVSNTISVSVFQFGSLTDWRSWLDRLTVTPNEGLLPVLVTALLVIGFDVLAVAYVVRFAILVFLAITAPLAGLLFVVPDTMHIAKLWRKLFIVNLLMQPMQLFVLSVGFALERSVTLPIEHLFALASLFILVKVPGAMGSAEKAAHKIEEVMHSGLSHVEHAMARAV